MFVFTVSSLTRICYSLLTFGRFSYQLHISSPSISVSATSVSYFYQHSESATMYLYKVSCDLLVSATLITYLYLLPKYSCQVFLLATPLYLLNFSTPNRYRISYPYQLLLSPYYTTAAQTRLLLADTPFSYFLSATPSYSYQLFSSATLKQVVVTTPYLLYQLHLAVGATLINQPFQHLFSSAAIS